MVQISSLITNLRLKLVLWCHNVILIFHWEVHMLSQEMTWIQSIRSSKRKWPCNKFVLESSETNKISLGWHLKKKERLKILTILYSRANLPHAVIQCSIPKPSLDNLKMIWSYIEVQPAIQDQWLVPSFGQRHNSHKEALILKSSTVWSNLKSLLSMIAIKTMSKLIIKRWWLSRPGVLLLDKRLWSKK